MPVWNGTEEYKTLEREIIHEYDRSVVIKQRKEKIQEFYRKKCLESRNIKYRNFIGRKKSHSF